MPLTGQYPVMQQHCPFERTSLTPQPVTQKPPLLRNPSGQTQELVFASKVVFPGHWVQVPLMRKKEAEQPQVLLTLLQTQLALQGILQIWRVTSKKVFTGQVWQMPPMRKNPLSQMHCWSTKTWLGPHRLAGARGRVGVGARVAMMQLPLLRVYPWTQSQVLVLALQTEKAGQVPHCPPILKKPEAQMQVRVLMSRASLALQVGLQMASAASQKLGAAHQVQVPLIRKNPWRHWQIPLTSCWLMEQVGTTGLGAGGGGVKGSAQAPLTSVQPGMHLHERVVRSQAEQGGQTSQEDPMRQNLSPQTQRPSLQISFLPQVTSISVLRTQSEPWKWNPMMHTHWQRMLSQTWLKGQSIFTGVGSAGGVQAARCSPTLVLELLRWPRGAAPCWPEPTMYTKVPLSSVQVERLLMGALCEQSAVSSRDRRSNLDIEVILMLIQIIQSTPPLHKQSAEQTKQTKPTNTPSFLIPSS